MTSSTSSLDTPLISAIFSTTYGIFSEEFRFPRFGIGARYGLSVSKSRDSSGAYSTTSTSFLAFLNVSTLKIVLLGLIAFAFGTAAGVLFGKLMCVATHGKVNPLIGSAGVSAVPMAARVSQKVGAEADPTNFLLMHAMGPNVAGVIGTAVAAGTFMAIFGVM